MDNLKRMLTTTDTDLSNLQYDLATQVDAEQYKTLFDV